MMCDMKFIGRWGLFVFIVFLFVGCTSKSEDELIGLAREHMQSRPDVIWEEREMSWDEAFDLSSLGRLDGTIPDGEWFVGYEPQVYQIGSGVVGVNWVGVPECELKTGETLVLGYQPELIDDEGFRCYVWWDILVTMRENGSVESVKVREVGVE